MSKRTILLLAIGAIAALVVGWQVAAFAGPVGVASGFEDDDANLEPQTPINFDWNNFDPTDWQGTAPYRITDDTDNGGWDFTGLEDAQAVGTDTAFAGGTKQNDDCATIIRQKANNKDDLKRVYLSSKTLTSGTDAGHVILNLAWARIPQNTTSPSAHVAFEFNQNRTGCSGSGHTTPSGTLVPRSTANGGDLLILYDFEGGTDIPTIRISRWTASGWTAPVTLPSGVAEAKVNTDATALDKLAPSDETLGIKEFGEAGIDLTDAGVFPATATSCLNFVHAFAVSRTSGNSDTAQMKDIAGPGEINLSNCGTVITRKVTDPADTSNPKTSFSYSTNVTTLPASNTSPFSLTDGESNTINNVVVGSGKNVTESDPGPNYALTDIDCSASTVPASNITTSTSTRDVQFSLAAGQTLDCTFTNTKQTGALKILKNSTKGGAVAQPGAVFSYNSSSVTDNGTGDEDSTVGVVCVSGLQQGDYTVNETTPPEGYGDASQSDLTATVVTGTNCTDNQPTGADVVTFTNAPLADIQVNFRDGGSGETDLTANGISCTGLTATSTTAPTGWEDSKTFEDLAIDPSPRTITCTIEIDP